MEQPPTFVSPERRSFLLFRWAILCCLAAAPATVRAQLKAAFTADNTMGCGQLSVQFTDQSTGNPSQWHWDFGNGNTASVQNPAASFTTPGTFPVTLTVSDGIHSDSHTEYITVYEPPVVKFSVDTPSGCYPLGVAFQDHSTPGTGGIASWTWDFGDGSPFSSQQNPTHVYDSAGTFVPKLSVTNNAGCSASAASPGTTIVTNQGVTVNFSADQTFSCTAPLQVTFTATTSSTQTINYEWDFGDGGTAAGKTATHTYTTKGNYTVTLTASVGGGGCRDVVTKKDYILVSSYTSDFVIPQGCAGTPLAFHNASIPTPASSTWYFGDGATATGANATHQYATSGTYEVTLVNDFGGCRDSVKKSITTYPSPTAAFTSDTVNYCGAPARVAFQNGSQGAAAWKWRFGDGDSSAEAQPVHVYGQDGLYSVSLEAVSDKGCVDSVTRASYIHVDAPDIRFTTTAGFGCVPLKTTFSIPAASAADIASYAWDFGDGSAVSASASPTHTYTAQGDYSVTLNVVTKSGCKFSFVRNDYIHTGVKSKANFSATPLEACRETPVRFTNLSDPPGVAWTWVFPQDNGATDTAENPVHHFSQLGSQDVLLIVNNNGCVDTAAKAAYIHVNPPKALFTKALVSCTDPYTFQFQDKSTSPSTWKWDFGDGTTSTAQNPTHKYQTSGAKRVVLTVSNGDCSSSDTGYLQVVDEHPVLSASPSPVCHGDSVTLSLGSVGAAAFYDVLTWDDGNGHTVVNKQQNSQLPTAAFAYAANGSYTPAVTIKYVNGCAAKVSGSPVTVRGPVADYTTSTNEVCQGNVVTFTDHTTAVPSGTALSRWVWNYGDGGADTTASGTSVHTYQQNGLFHTRLTVTDANGCTDETGVAAKPLRVNPSKADFSSPDTLVCPGSGVTWVNQSLGGADNTYQWDFGDGTTSTASNPPDHYYTADSVYTVSLKIVTDKGCSDSLVRPDYIRVGAPQALMKDSSPVKICRIYMDTSVSLSKNYRSLFWDFGDGFTSTRDTAYHIYNIPGTYTQRLIVQGYSPGCADTVTRQIIIAGPIGKVVVDDTAGCAPFGVHFSATNVQRAVSYQWFFGNGATSTTSTSPDASYTYTTGGLFHPTLKLTDDTGCYVIVPINDSLTIVVDSIGKQPIYSWPDPCDSAKIAFSTKGSVFSESHLGKAASYRWDFGDPSTIDDISTDTTPTYRYGSAGHYQATLVVKTVYGCNDRIPLEVDVPDSVALTATATVDPAEICAGKTVQLHASSNAAETYQWSPTEGLDNPSSPDPVAKPAASTTYQVTTSSQNHCQTATASVQVVVHDNPEIDAGPDLTVPTGSVVTLAPKGSADITSWDWSPATYLSCTTCENPAVTPRSNMVYVVQVGNAFGCTSSDSLKVNLVCDEGKVFIPNTFTPNGDGQNDLFYPRGLGVKTVVYFRIYNRFGQLVYERERFQLNDQSAGWDGKMKGVALSPDVFVYTAEMICDNDKIFKLSGNITLLR